MNGDIRKLIIDALKREIIGPAPHPEYLDEKTGEEILLQNVHGSPAGRYGAGMLFPQKVFMENMDTDNSSEELVDSESDLPDTETKQTIENMTEEGFGEEEPVGLAHQFKPSAMGFTVRFRINSNEIRSDKIIISVKSAYYKKEGGKRIVKKINAAGQAEDIYIDGKPYGSEYWIRCPIEPEPLELNISRLSKSGYYTQTLWKTNDGKPWLQLVVKDRSTKEEEKRSYRTITFTIVNAISKSYNDNKYAEFILYQNVLKIKPEDPALLLPLREKFTPVDTEEEMEMNLLYRNKPAYAVGHGTSVIWHCDENGNVNEISTSIFPEYEMPQIAPTKHVELSMYELSDMGDWEKAKQSLANLISGYEKWVLEIEKRAKNEPELEDYREAALKNAAKCRKTLERMRKGVNILFRADVNDNVIKAFRWMNHAMLWQQQRSKTSLRKWKKIKDNHTEKFVPEGIDGSAAEKFEDLKVFHEKGNGRWRPFQLAFILMNIDSIVNPDSEDREIVDLIWFPTGGGKTEAYLGLTAFTIFFRRLKGLETYDWSTYYGTTVLMRYTLRLLTAQQYERAASLIAACELIRRKDPESLGEEPISIGLWVGGTSTPNTGKEAIIQYNKLNRKNNADYNFVAMKCPACGTQVGKIDDPGVTTKIKGLKKEDGRNGRIIFSCENPHCEFYNTKLPLEVVDEYIYENPPTLLLGTVDKFAMVTWNHKAARLFGFREEEGTWKRINPPELIIQDELHLISGPLGTMVGLYETMIQTLCKNYSRSEYLFISEDFVPPKIVASTATISRAYEQVKNLYAIDRKEKLHIFPSQGLSFGDTWFSEEKSISEEYPGRKYVGILAPGYPSMQTTIVRAYAAILQKIGENSEDYKKRIDYYWTLMGYFNSIRELGGASSLVYSDIRERLSQIHKRELVPIGKRRYIRRTAELTSRIKSSEIPNVLKKLEIKFSPDEKNNQSLDICLATNMVATGVDVSRLGLMVIHGQPKTTAEYIQASSRVGRKVPEGPGLIITLYSPSKPRDKSQYEHFYSYHSRIYSYVEPTSVTPFSVSVRQRALHGVFIGLMRHFAKGSLRSSPIINLEPEFDQLAEAIKKIILKRCKIVAYDEYSNTEINLDDYISLWKSGFEHYGDPGNFLIMKNPNAIPLMVAPGNNVRADIIHRSLLTPTSMRNVDSESVISIYSKNRGE